MIGRMADAEEGEIGFCNKKKDKGNERKWEEEGRKGGGKVRMHAV